MAKRKQLEYQFIKYYEMPDGTSKKEDELTEEQRQVMEAYQYTRLCNCLFQVKKFPVRYLCLKKELQYLPIDGKLYDMNKALELEFNPNGEFS
jgi:hypothetical protein